MEDDSQKDLTRATSNVASALGKLNQLGQASVSATEDKKEESKPEESSNTAAPATEEKKEESNASTAAAEPQAKEEAAKETPAAEEKKEETPAASEEKKEGEEKKEDNVAAAVTEATNTAVAAAAASEEKKEGEEKKEETKEEGKEEKKEETKEEKKKREKEEKEKKEKEEKERKKREKEEKEKKEKEEKERKKKEKEEKEKEEKEKKEKEEKEGGEKKEKKKNVFTLRGRKKPAALDEEEKKDDEANKEEKKEGEEKKEETKEEGAAVAATEEVKEGKEEKKEGEATEEKPKEKEGSDSEDEKDGKTPRDAKKAEKAEKAEKEEKHTLPRKKGDLESFLEKRGEIGFNPWKKRHFRLFADEKKIFYFKNEETGDVVGEIDFSPATSTYSVGEKKEKTHHFHTLDIKVPSRTWHLRTENKEDHEAWVEHLGKHMTLAAPKTEVAENKEVSPRPAEHAEGEHKEKEHGEHEEGKESAEGESTEAKRESVVAEPNGKEEVEEAFVPKVEEDVPHPQRPLAAGDTALFIHKENSTSTVVEVRNLHVTEEGSAVVSDLPHSLVHKTVAFRSLTDSEASLASSSFPNDPVAHKKEARLDVVVDTEQKNQEHTVELLYQTKSGLNYSVEYNAVLDAKDKNLQLLGSYAISNTTGKNFKGASVFLVSTGLVRSEATEEKPAAPTSRLTRSLSIKNLGQKAVSASKSFDQPPVVKTLTNLLPRPVHLEDQSTTNVKFVAATFPVKAENLVYSVPATFNGGEPQTERDYPHNAVHTFNAQKVISFVNNKENKLGLDLPAGTLNVARREKDGFGTLSVVNNAAFKAEEAGKTVFVEVGSLPGVSATRKVTKFEHDRRNGKLTESFELTLQNTTNAIVTVSVVEAAYRGRNFELVNSSGWERGTEADADKLNATATVKPNDKRVLSYTLVYTVPAEVKK